MHSDLAIVIVVVYQTCTLHNGHQYICVCVSKSKCYITVSKVNGLCCHSTVCVCVSLIIFLRHTSLRNVHTHPAHIHKEIIVIEVLSDCTFHCCVCSEEQKKKTMFLFTEMFQIVGWQIHKLHMYIILICFDVIEHKFMDKMLLIHNHHHHQQQLFITPGTCMRYTLFSCLLLTFFLSFVFSSFRPFSAWICKQHHWRFRVFYSPDSFEYRSFTNAKSCPFSFGITRRTHTHTHCTREIEWEKNKSYINKYKFFPFSPFDSVTHGIHSVHAVWSTQCSL